MKYIFLNIDTIFYVTDIQHSQRFKPPRMEQKLWLCYNSSFNSYPEIYLHMYLLKIYRNNSQFNIWIKWLFYDNISLLQIILITSIKLKRTNLQKWVSAKIWIRTNNPRCLLVVLSLHCVIFRKIYMDIN
jgi:hypothetical protein